MSKNSTSASTLVEQVELPAPKDQSESEAIAALRVGPFMRHAALTNVVAAGIVKFDKGTASALDVTTTLGLTANKVAEGDLRHVSDTLLSQSVTLDTTMTELMRRAWQNAGEYPEAFHRYMNLALKAQSQARATLEALARIHQPREQIVKHVHVNEGGQAVLAEHLHIGTNGGQNAAIADQCHAPVAALPSPDPLGQGVPLPSGPGKEAVPDARRHEPRRAARQRQRSEARPENC